jgi:hypothetical protein
MSTERATKRRAKEKFMNSDLDVDNVISSTENLKGSSEDDAARGNNTLPNAINSRETCSDDDDLPIVNTLTSSATTMTKKKRGRKTLWTYETVVESTAIASKYWDVQMASERTTKRLAKEKLINSDNVGSR